MNGKCDSNYYRNHAKENHVGVKYFCDNCKIQTRHLSNPKVHKHSKHERMYGEPSPCRLFQHLGLVCFNYWNHRQGSYWGDCWGSFWRARYWWQWRFCHSELEWCRGRLWGGIWGTQGKHEVVTYSCPYCEYKSGWKINLKVHIKHKHEGNKWMINVIPIITEIMWRKIMKELQVFLW